uniref:Uncharacterized protein n=1 Tax=Arundo donax TaxID=35708 RepID=A0A0A9EGC3_ARUDO
MFQYQVDFETGIHLVQLDMNKLSYQTQTQAVYCVYMSASDKCNTQYRLNTATMHQCSTHYYTTGLCRIYTEKKGGSVIVSPQGEILNGVSFVAHNCRKKVWPQDQ